VISALWRVCFSPPALVREVGMAVEIPRQDLSAAALRQAAGRCRDAKAARRMLAIALVLDGQSREAAAEACGMDRQTLRDWVHRDNAEGLSGLANRRGCGPPPRLSVAQEAVVARWVEEGPDLERDGGVRWRCRDLPARIEDEFGVHFHERTIGKLLRRLDFRRLSVRPQHPESDPAEQEAFKGASPPGRRPRSRRCRLAHRSRSGSPMRRGSASRAR
jgi:transposase